MGSRREAREFGLQILYQIEYTQAKLKDLMAQFWLENKASEEVQEFTKMLVEGSLRNKREIDGLIEGSSTNWKLSRMAAVDRNLLRMAAYELVFLEEIPNSVSINEAVEIAKKFGTEESPSFINGILDHIANATH